MRKIDLLFLCSLAGCAFVSTGLNSSQGQAIKNNWERNEIMEHIRFLEKANGRADCELEVVKIEDRGQELRGLVEFWTIESCQVRTVYKVRKAPMGQGQYRYSVSYPRPADLL